MWFALAHLAACQPADPGLQRPAPASDGSAPAVSDTSGDTAGSTPLDTGLPDELLADISLWEVLGYPTEGVDTARLIASFVRGAPLGPVPISEPCELSFWSMSGYADDPHPQVVSAGDVTYLLDGTEVVGDVPWPTGSVLTARATGDEFPAFNLSDGVTVPTPTRGVLPARVDLSTDLVLHPPAPHADYLVLQLGCAFDADSGQVLTCYLPDVDEVVIPAAQFQGLGQPEYGGLRRVSSADSDVGGATVRLTAQAFEDYEDWFHY